MATWRELSLDSLAAAKKLAEAGHVRSSVSRTYYAAYSAVTSRLAPRGVSFPRGWNNPAHEQLQSIIRHHLRLDRDTKQRLRSLMRFLRKSREDADYRPTSYMDRKLALDCIRYAGVIMKNCEVHADEEDD